MIVHKIDFYNYNQNNLQNNKQKQTNNKYTENNYVSKDFPIGYVNINFNGKSIPKMWDEYNWYINHDKTPAIFSFLKIKESPEMMDKFMNTILESKDRAHELIGSIVYHPRKTQEIVSSLRNILPENSENLMPFMYGSHYNQAYSDFISWKVQTAKSVEDLLRIRPDWQGEVLEQKYSQLHSGRSLEIGNIPKDIPREELDQIVEYLDKQREYGTKSSKDIESLKIGNRKYDFTYFTEGKSEKSVFGVKTPEERKYVLKMSDKKFRSLNAPFALGTLAKIDSYLTYNRSRNSAPFCYYNHEKNFSIYKYIEHVSTNEATANLTEIQNKLPDFRNLGLKYNDTIGYKNFFLMDLSSDSALGQTVGFEEGMKRKEWVSVDNDHVTYSNFLQPSLREYHRELPNAMQMFF